LIAESVSHRRPYSFPHVRLTTTARQGETNSGRGELAGVRVHFLVRLLLTLHCRVVRRAVGLRGVGHLPLHCSAFGRRLPAARTRNVERDEDRHVPFGELARNLPGFLPADYHWREPVLVTDLQRAPNVSGGVRHEVDATVSREHALECRNLRVHGRSGRAAARTIVRRPHQLRTPGVRERLTLKGHPTEQPSG